MIKQCYHIVWSVERKKREKSWRLRKHNKENQCLYQTVQFAIVKKSRLIKEQEAKGSLGNMNDKILIIGPLLIKD